MSITAVRPAAAPAPAPSPGRDEAIDLVRAVCVTAVVVLHALMVGVSISGGSPVFANAAEGAAWFAPVTWFLQVMPLFFVIGGFAGATAYRRHRLRHGAAPGVARSFVAARLHRLLLPAVVVIGAVGVLLTALTFSGVPAELVAIAGYRFGQPLWFLAVFLLLQALLPLLLSAHERSPWAALLGLAGGAVVVDLVREATGADAVGILNLFFVWGALQQLGFFLADGRIDALRREVRGGMAGAAAALVVAGIAAGVWSPDLVAHLNPPTVALVVVGVAQVMIFSLLRGHLGAWAAHPIASRMSRFVNARAMTIYLWHMPVLLAMAGGIALTALAFGGPLPEPGSLAWWIGRPLWIAVALGLTAAVAAALGWIEPRRAPAVTPSTRALVARVLAGLSALVLLLVVGTSPVTALVAVSLLAVALPPRRAATFVPNRHPIRARGMAVR